MSRSRHLPIASRPPAPRAGFALLITLTLLAFLVVLLVGLATYTRIETAIAGNTQRQEQARQNALLALSVALGQLQKYAGPDQRVTATGEAAGSRTKFYTGVWDATATGTQPLAWLVSGSELPGAAFDALAAAAADPSTAATVDEEFLVGDKTVSNKAERIKLRKRDLTSVGVPGQTAAVRIGRYAWWVGDQGVKAPVALPDETDRITYAPFGDGTKQLDLGTRIRQQISLGAGAADANGPIFEPRDANNAPLIAGGKVTAANQIALLKKNGSTAALGTTVVQQNFHAWSPNNFAVLANTKLGGLRQDLSLFSPTNPSPLGAAFDAWANYSPYMEDSLDPHTPTPIPTYSSDPVRRRYVMQSATSNYRISPVLSFFGMSFSVRESAAPPLMEVASRCVIGLWNPYSAALVPEDLIVEVTQLPTIQVLDNAGGSSAPFSLQAVIAAGAPLRFRLPVPSAGVGADQSSWLPGRVYNWSALGNSSASGADNPMLAHHASATGAGGSPEGVVRSTGVFHGTNPTTPSGSELTRSCLSFGTTKLHIRLLRASDETELVAYDSPSFDSFGHGAGTTPMRIDRKYVDFAFVFRLPETDELPSDSNEKWLSAGGRDPRASAFPGTGFISGAKGNDPAAYGGSDSSAITGFAVADPNRLFDRATNSFSYDEDVPIFELPRAPILSLGELQHLALDGQRPFAIGNSWGAGAQLNGVPLSELFDRFYFSGLVPNTTPTPIRGSLLLPNPSIRVATRDSSTGATLTADDLRNAPNAQTSKFLLQGGAFSLNSTNVAAWTSTLSSIRFPSAPFEVLAASFATGTADDTTTAPAATSVAQFFRFSQSAQETYQADDPAQTADSTGAPILSTYAASLDAPPMPPNPTSAANTHLFRRGMKTLTSTQVTALAANIAAAVKARLAADGPFRSLEEFLGPANGVGTPSLIEQAILDADAAGAQINTDASGNPIEFSSQYLTQADIMTALAPVLFPRSDTFVIRAYGEALNPTTSTATAPAVEGRAWCEAIVQRVPEYFDSGAATGDDATVAPAALTNTLNQTYGRRFKIVSFRWLTRSDI